MADRPDYDVYLNGLGYMLARDGRGRVMGGACQELGRDPVQYYLSSEQRWNEVLFRFDAGAGAIEYDGTHRYRWGENIDTRGGLLRRGPAFHSTRWLPNAQRVRPQRGMTISDEEISTAGGAVDGLAVQFTAAYTDWLQMVAVLVKRDPENYQYSSAINFTVELWSDAADTPNAQLVSVNRGFEVLVEDGWFLYSCEPWAAGEYFWLFTDLSYSMTVGTKYWLVIRNANAQPVYWGRTPDETAMISTWNGAAWAAGVGSQDSPLFQLGYMSCVGGVPVDMVEFRGVDRETRLYAARFRSVLYWRVDGRWTQSVLLTARVSDLCVFNSRLFAAQGFLTDMQNSTGATATTVWAAVATERAVCFGVHDGILWKVGGSTGTAVGYSLVSGSLTGIGGFGANVAVGDPGTLVTALCSHGGALFAAKEEGIYQIDYPAGYPGSGTPTANLVLDFKTDRCLRPWLVSWQGGLYFPGTAAVYEWKNDVLRDIWTDRVDEGAQEVSQSRGAMSAMSLGGVASYSQARRYAAVESVPEDSLGFFQRGIGTTRGLVCSLVSPHLAKAGIWWYDGQGWHPMGPTIGDDRDALSNPLTEGIYADYILALFMESYGAGKGRLWFGCGYDAPYWVLPTWTRDRTQLDGVDFEPAWSVDLPVYDAGKPDVSKYFYAVQIMSKNPGPDPRIQVWVMVDGDRESTEWTPLADYVEEEIFQEIGLGLVGRNIRFRLSGYHGDDDEALLEVEALRLLYQVLPETMETYQVQLRAANKLKARNGATCPRTGAEIKAELMALLEEVVPWGYTDPLGDGRNVWALDVSSGLVDTQDPAGQEGPPVEMLVTVKMIKSENTLSIIANGDFLTGIQFWDTYPGVGSTVVWEPALGYPDVGSLEVQGGMIAVAQYAEQVIAVPQAGTYLLEMQIRTPDTNDRLDVVISSGPGGTGSVYLDASDTQCASADTWTYKSWEVVLTKRTVYLMIGVGGGVAEEWYVDSVRLTYPAE